LKSKNRDNDHISLAFSFTEQPFQTISFLKEIDDYLNAVVAVLEWEEYHGNRYRDRTKPIWITCKTSQLAVKVCYGIYIAKNVLSVMDMNAIMGDKLTFEAQGKDEKETILSIANFARSGFGE